MTRQCTQQGRRRGTRPRDGFVARRYRALAAAGTLVMTLPVASCDPCDDPSGCRTAPTVSYTVQFIEHATERAIEGVRVEFTRTSGVRLVAPAVTATTDSRGFARLRVEATEAGDVVGDVMVTPPPPRRPYRVPDVRLSARTGRGDGGVLGRWVVDPYISFIGEVTNRRNSLRLVNATISFRRRGGLALNNDSIVTNTDAGGRFILTPPVSEAGVVFGDIYVESEVLPRVVRLENVYIYTRYRDEPPNVAGVWTIGPSFRYVGEVYERSTQRRLANVDVEFVRTAGAGSVPQRVVARTDGAGRFPLLLDIDPGQLGEAVIGDLTFRPPGSARAYVVRGVRLPVFDSDEVRLLQVFGVGPSLLYVGEVYNRGSGRRLAGVEIEFRRTGGIEVEPAVVTARSDAVGRFPLVTRPLAEAGEVIGELTMRAPGLPPVTVPDVRMPVFDNDSVRLLRTFGVGEQLTYAGILFLRSTGRPPPPGVRVEFRRTGGIRISPHTFVVQSNDFGGFPLIAATEEAGEVVGDLTIIPPAPLRPEVRRGVRLRTFAADELRRLDNYGIGPSLQYYGELLNAADGRPIVGARVEFLRTGGIGASPERLTVESNADGRFRINPATGEYGELVGTVAVTTPGGRQYRFENVRLATFESDEVRPLQSWRVDP